LLAVGEVRTWPEMALAISCAAVDVNQKGTQTVLFGQSFNLQLHGPFTLQYSITSNYAIDIYLLTQTDYDAWVKKGDGNAPPNYLADASKQKVTSATLSEYKVDSKDAYVLAMANINRDVLNPLGHTVDITYDVTFAVPLPTFIVVIIVAACLCCFACCIGGLFFGVRRYRHHHHHKSTMFHQQPI